MKRAVVSVSGWSSQERYYTATLSCGHRYLTTKQTLQAAECQRCSDVKSGRLLFYGFWSAEHVTPALYGSDGKQYSSMNLPEEIKIGKIPGLHRAQVPNGPPDGKLMMQEGLRALQQITTGEGVYSMLSLWDRSATESRTGIAAWLAPGEHRWRELWERAREEFPIIVGRIEARVGPLR